MTLLCVSVGRPTWADETVTPPSLIREPPPESIAGDDSVTVLLELTIDETGVVREARVVKGHSAELDARALAVARALAFEPARQNETAIAATIRYAFTFEAEPRPAAPAPVPALAPTPAKPHPVSEALPEFEAVARVDAPPTEPVRRSLEGPVLNRVPGTRGDALRAIEVLPGVGRSSISNGDPILRGAASWESQTYIDGAPVPLLYHFGGLTSVYASRFVQRIDLYPSNFGVRYGRATGGVVEVTSRDPRTDRWHGMLELSLLENSALVEVPITDDLAVAAAARRTNIDFVYENLVPDATFDVVAAPVYYDYQGLATWHVGRDHTLRLRGYGSRDSLELFFAKPSAESTELSGTLQGVISFQRAQLAVESRFSDDVQQEIAATLGRTRFVQIVGGNRARLDSRELYARATWRLQASRAVRLTTGLDVAAQWMTGMFYGSRPGQFEGNPGSASDRNDKVGVEDTFTLITPAAYAELELRPLPSIAIVPGLRAEYFGQLERAVLDPRLSARADVSRDTTVKSGVGLYSQAPIYYEALPPVGNADLEPIRALHVSAGAERRIFGDSELGAELFYRRLWDRVVATEAGVAPYFENDGTARSYGMELSAELRPTSSTTAFVSYTLSRSERRDHDAAYRLFDYDQTHVLTLAGDHELGAGFTLGARFRLVSGNPQTPVRGAVYDATRDSYRPIYGPLNSDRAPLFHQLDVRLEKKWHIGAGSLAAYVELINAYNAQNREGTTYSFDYSKSEPVNGLPLFPNLGVRGEL